MTITVTEAKRAALDALYGEYAKTTVLQQLAAGRRLVPGHGPLDSPLVVVGEAPGQEEDRQGRPFVGASGQLLQDLFGRAGLPWGMCYVMNVLPWRPPGNRTPYPFEVHASWMRVSAEIAVIDPLIVVAAGAVAWKGVTAGDHGSFPDARFHWSELEGRRLLAIPHPSAVLRESKPDERARLADATIGALREARA
jgi:uracil-DNA glycosylase family 4